jgi:hypothetical protein
MRTVFALFNFKSSDFAAEERNYIEYHVQLARQLPGLRQYIIGRLRGPAGQAASVLSRCDPQFRQQ